MAGQDTGQILKYFAVIMAFLLTHECVGQTTDFPKTSMDFQFHSSGREAQVHYISEETLEYIVVVELNASQAIFIEQIKAAFAFNLFPLQLDDSTEITAADITTVCNFNDSGYKCVCEDQYVWPCEKCTEYGSCDDITNNTCRCINDIPTDRQFCQPVNEITNNTACAQPTVTPVLIEYLTEIQIDAENTSIIDELMNYWMFFDFPYTISDGINITEINITTVCSLNETQYRCKCEGLFVWPNDTCHSYEACDDIIDGSCTCINALPIDGQFCQFKEVTPVLIEYLTEIQIDAENTSIIDQLMNYWMLFDFPYTISDGINITEINITTVCSLNETQYRCKCEGLFVWPNDTCHSYEACDDIIDGSCTCINALPINGQFCQLKEVTPVLIEYLTEIQIDAENTSIIDQLMNYWMFFDFPYTISDGINITEINITTVCSLNETQYRCKCEGLFVWPNDTCHSYEACDDIIDGSCTCINALPIDGQFCQLKEVPTVTSTPSTPPVLSPSTLSPTSTPQLSSTSTLLPTLASMPPSTPLSTSTTPSSTTLSSMPPTSTPLLTSPTTPSSTTLSSTPPTSTPLSTLTPLLTSPTSTTPSSTTLSSTLASMPPTSTPLSTSTTPSSTTTLSSTSPTSTTQSITLSSTLASMPPTSTPSPTSTTSSPISTTPSSTSTTPSSTTLSSTFASMPPTSTPLSTSTTPSLTTLSSMPPTSTPLLTSPTSTTPSTNLSSTLASMPPTSTPLSTSLTSTTLSSTSATSTTPSSTSTTQSSTPLSTSPTSTTPLSTTLSSTLASIPPTSTTPLSTSTTLSSTLASMPSSSTQLPPPSPKTTVIGMSITLNKNFNSSLTNINSEDYKYLSGKIKATIELSYSKNLPAINYISGSTKVHGFRRGSVIADYTIKATSKNLDFSAANTDVSDSLKAQGIILTNADFAQSDYDCINEEIGFGKINDVREGICGNGMKGTKEYKCESDSSNWKSPVDDNCVLDAIYDIKSNITSLIQEDIPGFMANFSSVVEQNDIQMIQAPATIKAIVYILNIVAVLSQNISINKPEMVNFIKAVDTIVSGNVGGKWNELNKGNTSTILLSAIEKISERLIDDFAFNGISIQLNRTTIKNSFSITSTLPNSTTEIVIPQVPNVTTITIIIFTTLDNVLPTHTRNNHDTNNSDVRINGDVVVVKVNETLPKINFVFDTTNVSLGNPQCVFWNFSLDAWDSSGCEVKPSGNKEGVITCECNHTTSFSILMSPFSLDDKTLDLALALITYIGVGISMASLILCLIIEIIVWKSMTRTMTHDPTYTSYMRHVSIVNIAVSLLIANICFIIGAAVEEQEQAIPVARCSPAVFFMHFFYLALFFWMLISALLLFYRTVMVFSRMSRSRMMAIAFIVGYGAPLLIAVITVASTAGPEEYIPKKFACWLNWKDSMALLAFVIPALTIVAINLVVLIVVLYKMLRRGVGNTTQPGEKHALVVIARCVAILTPIFGLTWAFGIGTMVSRDFGIHVVFALLNSLQGLFILVFGTLLDKKVRELLLRKLSLQKLSSSHTNSTSAGSSSTPRLNFLPWIRRRKVYNVSEANTSSAADRSNSSYVILNT